MPVMVAETVDHPEIVTDFSSVQEGDVRNTTFISETYTQSITFAESVTLSNLRINNAGNGSISFELVEDDVVVDQLVLPDFEDGKQIYGLGYLGSSLPWDQVEQSPYTIDNTTDYPLEYPDFSIISYDVLISLSRVLDITYFLETIIVDGQEINLRGGVPFAEVMVPIAFLALM